jgi:hypothetical protein
VSKLLAPFQLYHENVRTLATKRTQRTEYITMKIKTLIPAMASACLLALAANANTITYVTPTGSNPGGGAVDAYATFVTGSGTVSITLGNLEANPTDVAQLISDLSFTLSGGQTSGTLASSSGQEITVNKNPNTYTLGSTVSTGWDLTGLTLDVLGSSTAPSHLIIGPSGSGGLYSDANGSIAGNGPHNPFLNQTATFVIDVSGVTDASSVDSATFSFGTTEGQYTVTGTPGQPPQSIPDGGTTALLLGAALSSLGLIRRRLI